MDPPSALLAIAPPDETALLDFVRAPSRVSREMIHEIALNDREIDVAEHELAILKQFAPNPALGFLPWQQSMEVLELERWNNPDSARAHFKRLLACTILLRNVAFVSGEESDGAFFLETSAATVIQLVRSSIALGSEVSRLTIGFLLWLHNRQTHPMLRPFVSFGVLLLAIQEGLTNLSETCAWVEEDEKLARKQLGNDVHSAAWLVGLNYQEDLAEPRRPWVDTFAQVLAARAGQPPPEVESALNQMHHRLSGYPHSEF